MLPVMDIVQVPVVQAFCAITADGRASIIASVRAARAALGAVRRLLGGGGGGGGKLSHDESSRKKHIDLCLVVIRCADGMQEQHFECQTATRPKEHVSYIINRRG